MEKAKRPCATCRTEGADYRCPCLGDSYCSKACQKASWIEHKENCTFFLGNELATKRTTHGDDAVEVGDLSVCIGCIFYLQGHYDKAEIKFLVAVRIYSIAYGDQGPQVAHALFYLGCVYEKNGKYVDAHRTLSDALSINRRVYGDEGEEVAKALQRFVDASVNMTVSARELSVLYIDAHVDTLLYYCR
jgi:tetratricopeptide (TPR) repeat protein